MCTHDIAAFYPCTIYVLPFSGITGFVVLIPQGNYIVFQSNATAVFSCSGDGYVVSWFLNGSGYNPENALMGITVVPGTNSKSATSSRLYVSSNPTYNNTEVYCKV